MAAGTDEWEYVTYAPHGAKCSVCRRDVKPLDPVRRGTIQQAAGPPVAVYRHAGQCPRRGTAAA
ncbi:hypothetical protein EKH77_20295 [Streptomyces luteoverticillatus]|uniref:Uncharacterized protein n=1 Tax=Streptomyces luteoverticillatus TaxID=66425 RepID=A0A3S9PLK9_STRLT|nr:hypothetical protein EKH77_20295 [Streptomyces luteoverticillatus]